MKKTKGSITIFSLLSLLLVTAVIFALLEGTRYQELQRFGKIQTELALEGVFSNYNLYLWDDYHLLGADVDDMDNILQMVANGRSGTDRNLLSFHMEEYQTQGLTRLTDGNGVEYIHAVSAYMEENLLYESAQEIYNQYEGVKSLLNQEKVDLAKIEKAVQEIENIQETASSGSIDTVPKLTRAASTAVSKAVGKDSSTKADSLLEAVQDWQKNGVLELVISDTSSLSDKKPDLSNDIFTRGLQTGIGSGNSGVSWMERILLQQYVLTYMSNYLDEKPRGAFSYEVEYLIGKQNSDKENLRAVVSKLLLVREVANFTYLTSNPVKVAQAEAMALTVGGASLNPAVIKIIRTGLLTAWSLAESILDVRALLAGRHIPLIKSEQTWTLELENIGQVTKGFPMAKESDTGIGYENYLGILLLFEKETDVAMYTMNAQEVNVRCSGDISFQMDDMLTQAYVKIDYRYEPVFPFAQVLRVKKPWGYRISTTGRYGYY